MKSHNLFTAWLWLTLLVIGCLATTLSAQTRTLRIVTYNIEADVGVTTPLPGLIAPPSNPTNVLAGGVLEGIGEEIVGNDPAQPLDILALQETTSNPITIAPIVSGLNSFYGVTGMYASSSYQATQFGGSVNNGGGNGPNALVYNTKTVQLLASVPVDPPGGIGNLGPASGEYREVMRYEFAPAGVAPSATNEFYIYVSHYKAISGTANENYRNGEAKIIRNDEANNLPATARVLYVGDYNVDNSGEPMYQTILSNAAPDGLHQGQGIDPLNPADNPNLNWSTNTTDPNLLVMLTEHSYNLEYRDDLQVMTTNVYYSVPGGLQYVPGTYHAFGNNGTTPYLGTISSRANTSLNNRLVTNAPAFISAAQLYLNLTDASDHLPVVADYTIPLPAPVISSFNPVGKNLVFNVANCVTGGVLTVLMSTNLAFPPGQLDRTGDQFHHQRQFHLHRHQCRGSGRVRTVLSIAGKVKPCVLTDIAAAARTHLLPKCCRNAFCLPSVIDVMSRLKFVPPTATG